MNSKKERKQRLSLTLLFSGIVVAIILSVTALVGAGIYLSVKLGLLSSADGGEVKTGSLLLIFVGACLIVGSVITFFLSRIPLIPVNNLLNIMKRVASGDFSPRISLPSPWNRIPGLAELSQSFNAMAAELEGTEMLRSDFINNFSHEFKTPIVSIAGFAELLGREALTERQAEYVAIIGEESRRLSTMATNVLNLSRLEAQSILKDAECFNLSEQLRDSILLLAGSWEKKKIEFSLDFHEHYIVGNLEMLKHVWLNLIDNAIKFSPPGGTVELSVSDYLDFIQVTVANTGPEIPEEKREKIFSKFYQADESHASLGSGVGLSIVKKVIELHQGSVSVQSENGINIFIVRIPKNLNIRLS